jgi:hypothetical protein
MSTSLDDLTFVVPFKIESPERAENLKNCVKFFAKTGARFIFSEEFFGWRHGVTYEIKETIPSIKLQPVTCPVEKGAPFYKTRAVNRAFSEVETEFFGVLDCDVICKYEQLTAAMVALREYLTDFVYPFDGRFVEVPRRLVPAFLAGTLSGPTDFQIINNNSPGGLVMGRSEIFRQIGGMNENFVSWGPEDMELHERVLKLNKRAARINGAIFHMEHPRGPDSSDKNPHFEANNREYARIIGMDCESLQKEVDSWSWKAGLWKSPA